MKKKTDIDNRQDIEQLVNVFYEKVKIDPLIGFFFTDVVVVNWDKHLPIMYDFWENVLFHTGKYTGNPMVQHLKIHQKQMLEIEHFKRWLALFNDAVDELFEGVQAETIKQRALNIATVMQIKFQS